MAPPSFSLTSSAIRRGGADSQFSGFLHTNQVLVSPRVVDSLPGGGVSSLQRTVSPHASAAMAARSSPVPPPAGEPDARVACRNTSSCFAIIAGMASAGRCSFR